MRPFVQAREKILPNLMVFAKKPGDDPFGGFELGMIRAHSKSPSSWPSPIMECSRSNQAGKGNLPGTCRSLHGLFETFSRIISRLKSARREDRHLDVASGREEADSDNSRLPLPEREGMTPTEQ